MLWKADEVHPSLRGRASMQDKQAEGARQMIVPPLRQAQDEARDPLTGCLGPPSLCLLSPLTGTPPRAPSSPQPM